MMLLLYYETKLLVRRTVPSTEPLPYACGIASDSHSRQEGEQTRDDYPPEVRVLVASVEEDLEHVADALEAGYLDLWFAGDAIRTSHIPANRSVSS